MMGPCTASTSWSKVVSRGSTASLMPPAAPREFSTIPARARSCWIERAKEYGMLFSLAAVRTEMIPSGSLTSAASMRSA